MPQLSSQDFIGNIAILPQVQAIRKALVTPKIQVQGLRLSILITQAIPKTVAEVKVSSPERRWVAALEGQATLKLSCRS